MKLRRLRYYKRSTVISVSRIDPSSEATRAYPAQAVDSKTLGSLGDGSIHFVTILLLLIDENRHLFAPAARNANHGKIDVNPINKITNTKKRPERNIVIHLHPVAGNHIMNIKCIK